MDVRLSSALASALRSTQAATPTAAAPVPGAPTFANALGDALKSVSATQQEATTLQRQFQAGADGVSLEETMIAMQKAQIGFQAAMTVRNRLVSAYTDIMNMSV